MRQRVVANAIALLVTAAAPGATLAQYDCTGISPFKNSTQIGRAHV